MTTDIRAFLFKWFNLTTPINDVPDRFYQSTAIESLPPTESRPFGIYRFGTLQPVLEAAGMTYISRQAVYIQLHDTPGDYHKVDDWLYDWVNRMGKPGHIPQELLEEFPFVVEAQLDYISEDLTNEEWRTAFRTLRFFIYVKNPYAN